MARLSRCTFWVLLKIAFLGASGSTIATALWRMSSGKVRQGRWPANDKNAWVLQTYTSFDDVLHRKNKRTWEKNQMIFLWIWLMELTILIHIPPVSVVHLTIDKFMSSNKRTATYKPISERWSQSVIFVPRYNVCINFIYDASPQNQACCTIFGFWDFYIFIIYRLSSFCIIYVKVESDLLLTVSGQPNDVKLTWCQLAVTVTETCLVLS